MREGNSVVLITGGCGAIGMACARMFVRDGWHVALVDRDALALDRCVAELVAISNGAALGITLDLCEASSPERAVAAVMTQWKRLDVLVNNAGLSKGGRIGEVALVDWEAVLKINLTVPMLLAQAAVPGWQDGEGGSIINVGSRVWVSGSGPAYTTSKAGLVGLTRSLAVQLGKLGVTVNTVAPSYIDTAFNGHATEQARAAANDAQRRLGVLGRLAEAEDIANAIVFLGSDRSRFITGEVLHVCGGAQLAGRPDMFQS